MPSLIDWSECILTKFISRGSSRSATADTTESMKSMAFIMLSRRMQDTLTETSILGRPSSSSDRMRKSFTRPSPFHTGSAPRRYIIWDICSPPVDMSSPIVQKNPRLSGISPVSSR